MVYMNLLLLRIEAIWEFDKRRKLFEGQRIY